MAHIHYPVRPDVLSYVTLHYVTLRYTYSLTRQSWPGIPGMLRHAPSSDQLRLARDPHPRCTAINREQSRISRSVIFLPFPFSTFLILSLNPPRFVSTYPERGFWRVTYQIYALKLWILPRHSISWRPWSSWRPWRPWHTRHSTQFKYRSWIEFPKRSETLFNFNLSLYSLKMKYTLCSIPKSS